MYTLDSSLTYDWATYCGIPSGIPARETIYRTMTTANTLAEINAAIADCPSGQTVFLSAGTYSIGQITFAQKSGVTLRGAGAGSTIINTTATRAVVNYEQYFHDADGIAIASGYTKGSLSITLSSAPSAYFVVGRLIQLTQDDNPDVWGTGIGVYHRTGFPGSYGMSATRNLRFTSRITEISGNTITLATPIPIAFSASLNPRAYPGRGTPTSECGLESMTIYGGGTADRAVYWAQADRCWLKDVETYGFVGTTGVNMLWASSQCEINRCYCHDVASYPNQADGFSYFLYYGCSCCKVEDNISYQVGDSIIVNGSSGNAVLYNHDIDIRRSGYAWIIQSEICNHGPHGVMNLFEGNITQRWQNDGYHGSTSHSTLFRNNIHGVCSSQPSPTNRRIVDLTRGSYYHNIVGCVIGDSSWTPSHYELDPGDSPVSCCYILGYPGMDSVSMAAYTSVPWDSWTKSTSVPDADVKATITRHGNYDYLTAGVYEWDSADHDLGNSWFYTSTPDFVGGLTWPPIGPDVDGYVTQTPAKWRWDTYVESSTLSDLFADSPAASTGFTNTEEIQLIVSDNEVARLYVDVPKKRVVSGGSVVYTVHAEPWNSFTGNITLDISSLPTNATDAYSTNPISETGSANVTVTTTGVAVGTHKMYITGTSAGGDVASVTVILEIVEAADADIKVPIKKVRAKKGDNAVFTIEADALSGYTSDVDLSVTGVPTGASSSFGDSSLAYNGITTLTVDTGTADAGTYKLVITGEGPE